MTEQSRSRQKNSSGSNPKAYPDFLPSLLYDDLESKRNSVGLVHPLVWESLVENNHRKPTLTTPRKNSKNVGTSDDEKTPSSDEDLPKYRASSNRKYVKDYFPDDLKFSFSTEITSKYDIGTISNESKLREASTNKKEKQTAVNFGGAVQKTTLSAERHEVLSLTRKLRSSRKDEKPARKSRSVYDFSIENMDWYYEDEKYYVEQCFDILSDFAVSDGRRNESDATRFYTYMLLDPRRCKNRKNIDWIDFIYAIFYIGKGTGDRTLQHVKDTETWLINGKPKSINKNVKKPREKSRKKFQKIEEIWESGNPITIFKVAERITDDEALTRETVMIDAMGLDRLCNVNRGRDPQHGRASMLKAIGRCEFGATLLVKAWDIFKKREANLEDVKPMDKEIFDLYFVSLDGEDELCYG